MESSVYTGINKNTAENQIRQLRQKTDDLVVLVEGLGDQKFYCKFKNKNVKIIISAGKQNAVEIIEEFSNKYKNIIAILDKDFQEIEDEMPERNDIFLTDTHDLETMILASDAPVNLFYEFPPQKLTASKEMNQEISRDVINKLLDGAKEIGALRLISKRENLELSFKKKKDDNKESLPFSKFAECSNKQINIDREKLVNVIREKSKRYDLDTNQLLEKSRELLEKNYDLWHLCCGHDMVNLLSLAIKKTGADKAANSENIEKYLRTVFQESHFQKTSLYQSLKNWENENKTTVLSF